MDATIQWVECSRCEKWRIIPARADGLHEEIPEVWFCEMNTDLTRNFCAASEQEYIEPVAIVRRLPKSNDPEAVRARLKGMSLVELQAAFDSFDIDEVLRAEFGANLIAARSLHVVLQPVSEPRVIDATVLRGLVLEAKKRLPQQISKQFTHRV